MWPTYSWVHGWTFTALLVIKRNIHQEHLSVRNGSGACWLLAGSSKDEDHHVRLSTPTIYLGNKALLFMLLDSKMQIRAENEVMFTPRRLLALLKARHIDFIPKKKRQLRQLTFITASCDIIFPFLIQKPRDKSI